MDYQKLLKDYYLIFRNSFKKNSSESHSKIRNKAKDSSPEGFQTIYAGLSLLLDINIKQIEKSITDGDKDYDIDSIYIPKEGSNNENIVVCDFKKNNDISYKNIKSFIENIEKYILDGSDLPRKGNEQLQKKLKELHDLIEKDPYSKIDIIIYREKPINNTLLTTTLNRLIELKLKYSRIGEIKIIDEKKILELIRNRLWYEGRIFAENYNCFNLFVDSRDFLLNDNTLIGTVSLFNLLQFIYFLNIEFEEYDVFNLNIRNLTDKSSDIRGDIIRTVLKAPHNFLKYHNGISIVCEDFDFLDENISFVQPQIVNGCQTISGLYEYFKDSIAEYNNITINCKSTCKSKNDILSIIGNIENLKKSKILLKINKIERLSEEPKKIAEYANSQTKVDKKELVVNNVEQLVISSYLKLRGINYFRKSGQNFIRKKFIFSIDRLYKFMYSYLLKDPSAGKNLKQNIFENKEVYEKLFPGFFSLDDVYKIADFYKKVIEHRKKFKYSRYYDDYLVFGLFLLLKEGNKKIKRINDVKKILDKNLEKESGRLISDFDGGDYMRFLQRRGYRISKKFIESIMLEFSLDLDEKKFIDFTNIVRKKKIDEIRKIKRVHYGKISLGTINDYINNYKQGEKIRPQNLVVKDILEENKGKINLAHLIIILRKFYSILERKEYLKELEKNIKSTINKNFNLEGDFVYLKKNGKKNYSAGNSKKEYLLKSRGSNGIGLYRDGKILVLKGSKGPIELVKSQIKNKGTGYKQRKELEKKGIIKKDGDFIVFNEDYLFGSPSGAAEVVSGRTDNGWLAWKDKNGITLHDNEGDNFKR